MKIYSFLVAGINGFLSYYLLKFLSNDTKYFCIVGTIYITYLTYNRKNSL